MSGFHPPRRSRPLSAVVLALLVLIAGCGGSDDPPGGAAASPASPAGSLAELADRLGCTGLTPANSVDGPTVAEQGTCSFTGGTATLDRFETAAGLTTWSDSVRGPDLAAVLFGPNWAIGFPARDAGEKARKKLGGRLV